MRSENTIDEEIERKLQRRAILQAYLQLKVDEQDWHGVADAAMDLRDIDSEIRGLRFKPFIEQVDRSEVQRWIEGQQEPNLDTSPLLQESNKLMQQMLEYK